LRDKNLFDGVDDRFFQVIKLIFEEFPDAINSFGSKAIRKLTLRQSKKSSLGYIV
jgi:hypothetical protein